MGEAVAADKVVVELEVKNDKYTDNVRRSATEFQANMTKIEKSAAKADAAVAASTKKIGEGLGQAGQRSRLLGYQIADIGTQLSGGQSPFLILAQQAPQVANALEGTTGVAGRLATFFSGPWGAALLAAASVVGVLVGRMAEATDAAVKKKKAIESLKQALADYAEANGKASDSETVQIRIMETATKRILEQEIATRKLIKAKLEQARAQVAIDKILSGGPGQRGELGTLALGTSQAIASGLDAALTDQDKKIAAARQAQKVAEFGRGMLDVAAKTDKAAAATQRYDLAVYRLQQRFAKGLIDREGLDKSLLAITRARDAALDAAKASNRTYQIGREINLDQAKAIVESVGGRVTSGFRSHEEQAALYAKYKAGTGSLAAPPGQSDHEIGQAVDVAKTAGLTLAKLVDAFKAQGVAVHQALDEGNHFHIGFGAGGKSAESLAKEAEAARVKRIRTDEDFENEVSSLDQQIIQARRSQLIDAGQQADLERALVVEKGKKYEQQIAADLAAKKYSDDEGKTLRVLNALSVATQLQAIDATEKDRKAREAAQITVGGLELQRQILSSEEGLAVTARERREIALRIVDLDFQIEQAKIDELQRSKNAVDRAEAAARQGSLNDRRGLAIETAKDATRSTAQRYLETLNRTPAQLHEDLEGVGVSALEKFNQGLDDSIAKTLHLHGILGSIIGDLIDMAIKQALIRPLANALFGGGSASDGGGGIGGLFKSVLSLVGIGGGGVGANPFESIGLSSGFQAAESTSLADFSSVPIAGLAGGGQFPVQGAPGIDQNILSVNGEPRARVSSDETVAVIPNNAKATQAGGGVTVLQTLKADFKGAITTRELMSDFQRYADARAQEAGAIAYHAARAESPRTVQQYDALGTL